MDNCPDHFNPGQENSDGDALGDACDLDNDNDTVPDASDNCPQAANPAQVDTDGDGLGDACDNNDDGDGLLDVNDPCPLSAEDYDGFQDGDGCPDTDNDVDGVCDPGLNQQGYCSGSDSCPNQAEDADAYKDTDGCPDPDNDSDGFPDGSDHCPGTDYTAGSDGIADSGDEPMNPLPTLTREDTDGVIDTDGCHDSPGDDFDGDSLSDEDEVFIYGTNPERADTDSESFGDGLELACGSNPLNPGSRPERIDGIFAGVDDDGDGQADEALPLVSSGADCDGDGYTGSAEAHVFTATNALDQDPCGTTAWPSDFVSGGIPDSTNRVTITDLTSFLAPVRHINTSPPEPEYADRWDLVPGAGLFPEAINISDLTSVITVAPPMLGGVRAFNGPPCPWPP